MDLTFYFVALVKGGQISWLKSGPFISEERAKTSLAAIELNEKVSGSCWYQVVKAEINCEPMELVF